MTAQTLKLRIQLCTLLAGLPALAIAGRLFWLQAVRHDSLSVMAQKSIKRTVTEVGPRGRIFGAGGTVLAESILTWDAGIYKRDLVPPKDARKDPGLPRREEERAAAEIMRTLNPEPGFAAKFRKAKNFVPIRRGLGQEAYTAASALGLKGLVLEPKQARYYPSGDIARGLIGLVNSERGLTGIELLYDKVLKGKVDKREVIRDAAGRVIFSDKLGEAAQPRDIYLTIDRDIQFFAQEKIREMVVKSGAELGMALVQDPRTGEILAMASWPDDKEKLPPVEWVYEPGSTFKAVTLAAALEKGTASEKDVYHCENGAWKFNSKVTITDHEKEGDLTLSGVIERSSNIGAAKIGLKLGVKDHYLYAKSFGFGAKSGLGFYGESGGILRPLEKYTQLDLAVGSYGYAIAATPLQVLGAYSALANGGRLYVPRLVKRVTEHDGTEVFSTSPELVRQVIRPETAARVKEILRRVVERGTGKPAAVPGYHISGKTGTANKIDPRTGKYMKGRNVASFAGFFPYEDPQYTILVIMDNPRKFVYGSEASAPVFRDLAKRIITLKGIRPDKPAEAGAAGPAC